MIFVYLLLSLVCSAVKEIIESWLKHRATDLERGLRELLTPNSEVKEDSIVGQLYNHPLINGLYKGTYQRFVDYMNHHGSWRWLARLVLRPKLPSYIPARNFALALMDTILPGNVTAPARAEAAATNITPTISARAATDVSSSGATGATPPAPPPNVKVNLTAVPPPPPPLTDPANPLNRLRNAIVDQVANGLPQETERALLTLIDAAGNDVSKLRENIETWFNSSMDRVSGWYKRRSQIIIFILGLLVAIAINADSVTLVRKLSTDKTMRDSLVAAAEAYAKANPTPAPTPSPGAETTPTPATSATPGANSTTTVKPSPSTKSSPSPLQSPSSSPPASPSPSTSPSTSPAKGATASASPSPAPSPTPTPLPDECVKDINSPECKLAKNRLEIAKLGLPIGWTGEDKYNTLPGNHWKRPGGWWDQLYWHWLGWLITALAVSLGAPFWFDLLNKFIVIRSTVKPHEKSPEEKSKQ
jgi:hypothetical protein